MMIRLFALVSLLLTQSSFATAGEFAYICNVHNYYELDSNGSLKTSVNTYLETDLKNSPFSVSRETGALSGITPGLDTSLAKTIRVINKGSSNNPFIAIADLNNGLPLNHNFQIIKILEYRKGIQKPFILIGPLGEITGTCK